MDSEENILKVAHAEGHTFVCFDEIGRYFVTCGSDGYVKIWDGFDDCDPLSRPITGNLFSVAVTSTKFYAGADSNSVFAYTFPDGNPDGLTTRFTASATHMVASNDGRNLLVGSSDFSIKFVMLHDNRFKVLLGHEAPILSVAVDQQSDLAASSSCDGSVRVWKINKQKCIKSWANVFPKSNDFSASKVCCRLAWQPLGNYLAVPWENSVKLFLREKWDESKTLVDSSITELVNVVCFSNCGKYLAAGCLNGIIVVWNVSNLGVVNRLKHKKDLTVCSMAFNPNGNGDLVFCDTRGQIGCFKDTLSQPVSYEPSLDILNDIDNFIDDDDNDENTFSISKIKASVPGLDDYAETEDKIDKLDEENSEKSAPVSQVKLPSTIQSQHEIQSSFQPGSTPVHYQRRFMVWNSVGIVRCFNTEEENAIEIEFHDTSVHHSMHLENMLGHTMSDVSNTAVALACKTETDHLSQLVCLHFATWDSRKQWTCEMPAEENIETVSVSEEWVCIVTNRRQIRILSIGGIQNQVLALPGPVVATAANQNQFVIAFHSGMGLPGNQCLSIMLLNITWKNISSNIYSLPLSAGSTLAWIGFTDEGTPSAVDSEGVVRVLQKSAGDCWIEIANTKSQTKGLSDHYFVVGVSEIHQQIRCILCKGSRYPPTLPHPVITILPFRLPLCNTSSQFGHLEESYLRVALLSEVFQNLDKQGYETDTSHVKRTEQQQKESLMKLFALSCKSDQEFRSVELAKMMDSYHTVQLAIRYASQLKYLHLAEKLGEVAYEKLEQETAKNQIEVEKEEAGRLMGSERAENISSNITLHTQPDDEVPEEQSQELFDYPKPAVKASPIPYIEVRHNPFKVDLTPSSKNGMALLDSIKLSSSGNKKVIDITEKSTPTIKTSKQQTKLSMTMSGFVSSKTNKTEEKSEEKSTPKSNGKLGVQLWMEANLEKLKSENPDTDESKLAILAATAFKQLSSDEKLKWNNEARRPNKRKLDNESSEYQSKRKSIETTKSKTNAASKLKSFAFKN
ncbi:WD repeat and HMG-box DNA binding-domain containing protein 1 [Chamberlinius hualienensis]